MSRITINFDMPEEILNGLSEGVLERSGGVIRRADGKNVVAWLKETGSELNDNSLSGQGIPQVLQNQQVMMGLQIANLAVSVAGFAVVCHKLDGVKQGIERLDSKLEHLQSGQDWLDKKQLLTQVAPIASALESMREAALFLDQSRVLEKVSRADDILANSRHYFKGVLGQMLADQLEHRRPQEFAACYRAWVLANQGAMTAAIALNETPLAVQRSKDFTIEHARFGSSLHGGLADPITKLAFEKSHVLLMEISRQAVGVHEILKGQVQQLEFVSQSGISLSSIDAELRSAAQPYALCVVDGCFST